MWENVWYFCWKCEINLGVVDFLCSCMEYRWYFSVLFFCVLLKYRKILLIMGIGGCKFCGKDIIILVVININWNLYGFEIFIVLFIVKYVSLIIFIKYSVVFIILFI